MAKVTNHAKRRMHSRIGITKGIAQKQALKVLRNGIKHEETLGNLHKWMDAEFLRYRTANNMRYYAGKLYIFDGEVLITVLHANQDFEASLSEYVEEKAYKAYYSRRESKKYKHLAARADDRKKEKEEDLLHSVKEYAKKFHPDIEITRITFVKERVVRVNYVSDSKTTDWGKYTDIIDFLKATYSLGSYLKKVRNIDNSFITIEEWRQKENKLLWRRN